jgi:Cu/Zn superoxide dismutase
MKRFILLLAVLFIGTTAFVSCKKESENNTVSSSNAMTGSQQVPANSSTATGTVNVTYNKDTKNLTYTITWSGLTSAPTAMHFHGPAAAGANAAILIAVNGFPATVAGSVTGSVNIASLPIGTAEADLLAGKIYFNISTANYPAGEIRGQISF